MSELAVITTIQPPTKAVKATAKNIKVIIIGDHQGPLEYRCKNTEFYSHKKQLQLSLTLPALLPSGHYSRKNVGYLLAIQRRPRCIYDTDDDNAPCRWWHIRSANVVANIISGVNWFNPYREMTDKQPIWPRGFPLQHVLKKRPKIDPAEHNVISLIQQGLADGDPDVDAIWRLTQRQPIYFNPSISMALDTGVWCPFNSQSSWWFDESYPLLYLPSYCPFRVTDIWRSFVAQRCLWAMGSRVTFHSTEVIQQRNKHDLMKDFKSEIPCYLDSEKIANILGNLKLKSTSAIENLVVCYEALVKKQFMCEAELDLVHAWIADLKQMDSKHETT